MARCSFCRRTVHPGTGFTLIKNDGHMYPFCRAKCEKNLFKLEHVPRTTKWTGAYRLEKKSHKKKDDKGV